MSTWTSRQSLPKRMLQRRTTELLKHQTQKWIPLQTHGHFFTVGLCMSGSWLSTTYCSMTFWLFCVFWNISRPLFALCSVSLTLCLIFLHLIISRQSLIVLYYRWACLIQLTCCCFFVIAVRQNFVLSIFFPAVKVVRLYFCSSSFADRRFTAFLLFQVIDFIITVTLEYSPTSLVLYSSNHWDYLCEMTVFVPGK